MVTSAQTHHKTFTATPPAPPPVSIPVEGVSGLSSVPVMVTVGSKPDEEIPVTSKTSKTKISNIPMPVSKC